MNNEMAKSKSQSRVAKINNVLLTCQSWLAIPFRFPIRSLAYRLLITNQQCTYHLKAVVWFLMNSFTNCVRILYSVWDIGRERPVSRKLGAYTRYVHCYRITRKLQNDTCKVDHLGYIGLCFKFISLFHIKYLVNGALYSKLYYRVLIENHTLAFDWCHFWWPWRTFEGHFSNLW